MKQVFQIIITVALVWLVLEVLAVLFGFWVFGTSVKHLDQMDHSKGKQYHITLTSSQRQANDAEKVASTSVPQSSQSSPEGIPHSSTYNANQGQCQDANGNWKFVDKFNNPMPADWQPTDGTDYQAHLNPNYQGD